MSKEDEILKVGLALGAILLISKANAKASASASPLVTGSTVGQTIASLYNQAQQVIGGTSGGFTIDQIAFVQALLNQVVGTDLAVDGILGNDTANALGVFQTSVGLGDTGVLDATTYNALLSQAGYPV